MKVRKDFLISLDTKKIVLFCFCLIMFTLSFQFNMFGAASDDFFNNHDRVSEALVIGRIIESNKNGYMSHGGFLGRYSDKDKTDYQHESYKNSIKPDSYFGRYTSSAGFQGFFYRVTDQAMEFVGIEYGKDKLFILKLITSFLSALTLSFFVKFAFVNLGLSAAITSALLIVTSQWLVFFSNSLYWMFFLVMAPFVISTLFLMKTHNSKEIKEFKYLYLFIFISILIKSLAGYEYMSTIFISMVTPFVFFSIKDNWNLPLLTKRVFWVSVSAILGFFAAIVTHVTQLGIMMGDVSKGLSVVWMTVVKRTHGNPDTVNEVYRGSLESSFPEVFMVYWNGRAFNLDSLIGSLGVVTFGELIVSIFITSIIGVVVVNKISHEYKNLHFAILASTWFSILAPLSWYFLAKGHSYIHSQYNQVLWYVPFLLLAFAYIGFITGLIVRVFLSLNKYYKKCVAIFISSCILLILFSYYYNKYTVKKELLLELNQTQIINNMDVGFSGNNMLYLSKECTDQLSTRFFLHLTPIEVKLLPENRQQYGFDNYDFNWLSKQVVSKDWFVNDDVCIASVALPFYPLRRISTGQFNSNGMLWQDSIDLAGKRFNDFFQPYDLSDSNWSKGISKTRAGFFIKNSFENRQSVRVGDTFIFSKSGERTVQSITYSKFYVNLFVSGELLSPELDGFPNIVRLKIDKSSN